MATEALLFDPGMLVWDREHFGQNERTYWKLAGDLMTLFDVMERASYEIILSSPAAELVLESFPADDLSASGNFADFLRATYSFLAKIAGENRLYSHAPHPGFTPDISARTHFSAELGVECKCAVTYALLKPNDGHVASHEAVWPPDQLALREAPPSTKALPVWLGADSYFALLDRTRRIYEKHMKHDPESGYGSRLPETLEDADIQRILDAAIEANGPDCLCARSRATGTVLIFRRHHGNAYHAYPIDDNELSKYGINPNVVPEI